MTSPRQTKRHPSPWLRHNACCILAASLVLAGCASGPVQEVNGPSSPGSRVSPPVRRPAVDALQELLGEAREQAMVGNWAGAIASAERGLRIDRRQPELYLLLARSYRALGRPDRARQFAGQGLRYIADPADPVAVKLMRLITELEQDPAREASKAPLS